MTGPEARESFFNPQGEFDLERGLLGPNLRRRSQLTSEQEKEFFENPTIILATYYPHSTLGSQGIFATGEIYGDCYRSFGLERLQEISGFGEILILPDEVAFLPPSWREAQRGFVLNKWIHSLMAAGVNELMLRNNRFPEKEVATGIVATLLHDAAVPPFSDFLRGIASVALDEAQNLPLYLEGIAGEDRDSFEHKYAPDYPRIFEAVKGEGVLGAFLKIADRLAYTASDASFFAALLRSRRNALGKGEGPLEEMVDIFEANPYLFDIFKEVKFDSQKEQVYFENPQNLALVLRIRALMYAYVYLNPERLGYQATVRRAACELINEGEIKPEELLTMTDHDLKLRVGRHFSFTFAQATKEIDFFNSKDPKKIWRTFANPWNLAKFLVKRGENLIFVEDIPGFDTLGHWLVKDPGDGEVKSFAEVCPEEVAKLEELNFQTQRRITYFVK